MSATIDRATLDSEQTRMLTKALGELREGVAATKRMLLERCELREASDGQFRSTQPISLGVAKSVA